LAYAETYIFNSCKCVALFPPENARDAREKATKPVSHAC